MKDSVKRFLAFISGFVAAGFFSYLFNRHTHQAQPKRHSLKPYIISFVAAGAVGTAVVLYLLFNGPHMREQPNLRAHDWAMPAPPAGSVPVHPRTSLFPDSVVFTDLAMSDLHDHTGGRRAYGYYCIFCHGPVGDGNGPVGQSYVPRPSDLRTRAVQTLADGELLRRSLTGIGHSPVLQQVVPPVDWSSLVLYLRTMGTDSPPAAMPSPVHFPDGQAHE